MIPAITANKNKDIKILKKPLNSLKTKKTKKIATIIKTILAGVDNFRFVKNPNINKLEKNTYKNLSTTRGARDDVKSNCRKLFG
ncbi:hypothetical protein DRJ25_02390 [Candidatus Woesearchaeota archaeon]|nr:MAG: hypothetical protein DRJ25_02390 [Candidatus Woesearchaeota archaeon]